MNAHIKAIIGPGTRWTGSRLETFRCPMETQGILGEGFYPDPETLAKVCEMAEPGVYIVMNPLVLDHIDWGNIWCIKWENGDFFGASLLSDHPHFRTWSQSMTPGEFWSYVGNDWVPPCSIEDFKLRFQGHEDT